MARQPLIALLGLGVFAGCSDDLPTQGYFDGPQGAAVLSPEDGGPFEDPVGFVANIRRGTIVPLDLKHAVFLADAPGAPFLSPRQIATGDERDLGDVAVWAPDDQSVTVYATDLANHVMIEAPYITAMDPYPEVVVPTSTDPVFVAGEGSNTAPTLSDVVLRESWTTTEDWSVAYNGERWWVFGTRSGKQTQQPIPGTAYCTDRRELCFTLDGDATSGDRFELHTDNGLVEHDLGGDVLALSKVPGQDLLAAAVWDATTDTGTVVFWDLVADIELGRVAFPEGAQPWRFAFDPDAGEIFVGDAYLPAVYRLSLDSADPAASALSTLETAAPVASLAWSPAGDAGRLGVALAELDRVDLYDLASDTWVDANPLDGEVAGVPLHSPIVGLSATPEAIRLQEEAAWGARYESETFPVTTADGSLRMVDAETGCLVAEVEGPRLSVPTSGTAVTSPGETDGSESLLRPDDATGWEVLVNPCGGVARDESWNVTFDGATGDWQVEGSRSGIQQTRALAEQRYLSDHGEISFTIENGSLPPTDGDTFSFLVDEGTLRLEEVPATSSSTLPIPFEIPAAPVVFQYDAGPTGGGWDEVDRRTFALLPLTNTDKVLRVRLTSWTIEVGWN